MRALPGKCFFKSATPLFKSHVDTKPEILIGREGLFRGVNMREEPCSEIAPNTAVELWREDAENLLEVLGQGEIFDDDGLPESIRRLLDIWHAHIEHRFDFRSPLARYLIDHTDKPTEDVIRILKREAKTARQRRWRIIEGGNILSGRYVERNFRFIETDCDILEKMGF